MKANIISSLTLAFVLGGCATTPPPAPRISYPVTYQIHVGNAQVRSSYGPQNLNVNATQDVTVEPGQMLYYRVVSPVDVVIYVYDTGNGATRTLLSQMQGSSFTASIMPNSSTLQFVFSVTQPNSNGVLQFTLSDQQISPESTTMVPPPTEPPPPAPTAEP